MPDQDELLNDLSEAEEEGATQAVAAHSDNEIETAYSNLSFRIVYQTNNFFLPQIKDLIAGREILNLRPEYQRRLRWSNKKKSLLIESLLLNIPVPPIFLYESDLARYEVMDGQQRLNAIHDFMGNSFSLTGLEKLDFLNGRPYNALPPKIRRSLDRASLSAIVLLQETKGDKKDPFLVRKYVFERLNTGGEKLNPQEIRNSIYRGNFNDLIVALSRNDTFCEVFGIPQYNETDENEYYENPDRQKNRLYRTMADCQIVLRFFALKDDEHIRGSMHNILENCMKRNSKLSDAELDVLKNDFVSAISTAYEIFNKRLFLLPPDKNGREKISLALYDALMVALHRQAAGRDNQKAKSKTIRDSVNNLLAQNLELFTGRANTAQSIKDRITSIENILVNL